MTHKIGLEKLLFYLLLFLVFFSHLNFYLIKIFYGHINTTLVAAIPFGLLVFIVYLFMYWTY